MGYQDYLLKLAPWWLDYRYNNGRLLAYGYMLDTIFNDARNAALNSWVQSCDPSALDALGANFNLPRIPNELDEHYRAYLKTAWSVWQKSGSDQGIIEALNRLGMQNVRIIHWQTLMEMGIPFAFGGGYHLVAAASPNGGVRFVNLQNQTATVIQQVFASSAFSITVATSSNHVTVTITLQGDLAGNAITTAKQVATAFRVQKIGEMYGVYADATGTGLAPAGAGTVILDYPIYTHFFIQIDQPNSFIGPFLWDGNPDNLPLVPIRTATNADLHAIAGVYGQYLYIVGQNGTIFTWNGSVLTPMTTGTTNTLLAISMLNSASGLVVGENGEALRLIGNAWIPSATGVTNNLNCCYQWDPNNALAAGDGGTTLQMTAGVWAAASFPAAPTIVFHGMVGFSSTDVWMCGDGGNVARWNGAQWTFTTSPVGAGNLLTISGSSDNDIWVGDDGGGIYHWNGISWVFSFTTTNANAIRGSIAITNTTDYFVGDGGKLTEYTTNEPNPLPLQNTGTNENLFGVWAAENNQDLWVVGENGTVLRRINAQLIEHSIPEGPDLLDIWSNTAQDIWAVGNSGRIMHWDGLSWSDFSPVPLVETTVQDFWSFDGSDIWLVGSNGLIARRNPAITSFWFDYSFETVSSFYSVSGSSLTDAWAVGDNGIIVHWDGAEWLAVPSGTTNALYGVFSVTPTLAYCVGEHGIILRWDGGTWKPQQSPTTQDLYSVTVAGNPVACGAAGTVVRNDGIDIIWTLDAVPVVTDLHGIAQLVGNTAVAVGETGTVIEYDGSSWNTVVAGTSETLYAVTVYGTRITTVGANGTIVHFNGATWITQTSGVTYDLYATWANADLNGLAAGQEAPILLYTGAVWETDPFDTGLQDIASLSSIFAIAANDMWVVGNRGTLLHWDGIQFTKKILPTNAVLRDVWASSDSDVYVCGYTSLQGEVWHYNGTSWALAFTVPNGFFFSLWGSGVNQVRVAGASVANTGAIWSFDGVTWTSETIPVVNDINKIRGWDSQHIYASTIGTILFFNGTSWTSFTVPADLGISLPTGLDITSPTTFYMTVNNGIVYYWDGMQYQEFVYPTLFRLEGVTVVGSLVFIVGIDIADHGVILQLTPNTSNDVWDGGGLWDFGITDNTLLTAVIDVIRKFKASGTSCRFLKINVSGEWITVPVGELIEIDTNGDYTTPAPSYLTSWTE